ncbi:trans-aconitate 2-methyltransferase [Paenarthrobacter sp. Z7-10]|uniref:trans-aconitate 2-methyltransferase n=1 Tax=Paenarthrobacter sp. Z7-10 TaxID=2787635 RepID=UPI0022A9EF3D|nr:trans-aconitate 2-methyltransferase [Paenarthrobacter sp. Z7-10]MCZ2404882.1 trans-aconitate 2-methyltransferase [Paenarthrobacter sp. Z7-10]
MHSGGVEWDPVKYVQFGNYRDRPFFDLTGRISAESPRRVVDLGCGPGNLTAALARRWPDAEVLGLDSSAQMIETARQLKNAPENLSFQQGDIASWMPDAATDVLVSNAALQWVPGHQLLMKSWLAAMMPGSWLAVQVPGNFGSPSHALMRRLADSPRWRSRLGGVLRHEDAVAEPEDYLQLLLDAGWLADGWETTYQQVLQGEHPVLEWVRGTGLRPVLAVLDAEEAREFEAVYSTELDEAYPPTENGILYPFRRLFCVGQKIGQRK